MLRLANRIVQRFVVAAGPERLAFAVPAALTVPAVMAAKATPMSTVMTVHMAAEATAGHTHDTEQEG